MMTTMLRSGILATAERDHVERFIRHSSWSRTMVARFVAGDRLEDALVAANRLAAEGFSTAPSSQMFPFSTIMPDVLLNGFSTEVMTSSL